MALGDNTNTSNNNQYNESTYYSRLRFRNEDLSLSFSFWKGLLKVYINQSKQNYSGTEFDELAAIYLSPMKAKMLSNILKTYKNASHTDTKMYGIDAGSSDTRSVIAFGIDPTSTKDTIKRFVIIGKVDPNGNIQSSARFDFNVDYNFAIEWNNFEKMDCGKVYDNTVELDSLIILLDQFVEAMTGAMCYSVLDMGRFDYSRINTKIELVMDALNIERKSSRKNTGNGSNSFFNKSGAASPQNSNRGRSSSATMEDIEDMMS